MSAIVISLLSSSKSHAQAWTAASSVRVGGHYDSNIRLVSENRQSSSNGIVDAAWTLSRKDERLSWSVAPRVAYLRYEDQPLLDRTDKSLSFSGKYLGERASWTGGGSYVRDNTLTSELGLSGITAVSRTHEILTAKVGPTVRFTERSTASFDASWSENRYERSQGTGLTDYDYGGASLASGFAFTERTQISLSAYGGLLRAPVNGAVTRNWNAQLQLTSEMDQRWSWTLAAGPSRVITDIATDDGLSYSARMQLREQRTTFSGEIGRDVIPTGRGSLSNRVHGSLSVSHSLSEYMSASIDASWTRNRDIVSTLSADTASVRYVNVSSSLQWRFLPTWHAWISTGWVEQDYSLRTNTADGWRGGVGFTWQSRERAL